MLAPQIEPAWEEVGVSAEKRFGTDLRNDVAVFRAGLLAVGEYPPLAGAVVTLDELAGRHVGFDPHAVSHGVRPFLVAHARVVTGFVQAAELVPPLAAGRGARTVEHPLRGRRVLRLGDA